MNIPKHIEGFANEAKRRGFAYMTIKNYKSNLFSFFKTINKEHPLHVNADDIKQYLSTFTEPNTQRSHHSAIKLFFDICLGQKDKFKYIPYAKKSKKLPIVLS